MDLLVYAVLIVAMLGPLVLLHEFGHFSAARLSRLHVERFDVGAGPRLFVRAGATGTSYGVCAIPVGAYCRVSRTSYAEAPPSIQLFYSLAGSSTNFLLAGMLLVVAALLDDPKATVVDVAQGPAWEAGLRGGDQVVAVDGAEIERWPEVGTALVGRVGDTGVIEFTALRDGRPVSVAVPIVEWQSGVRQIDPFAALGIRWGDGEAPARSFVTRTVDGVVDTFVAGFATAAAGIKMILGELSILNFGGALWLGMLGEDDANLLTSEDRQALSWVTWVRLVALLSIGLGVINLLPGPVVDGAAVMCATLALARRRAISEGLRKGIFYVGAVFGFGPLVLCIVYETMAVL